MLLTRESWCFLREGPEHVLIASVCEGLAAVKGPVFFFFFWLDIRFLELNAHFSDVHSVAFLEERKRQFKVQFYVRSYVLVLKGKGQ